MTSATIQLLMFIGIAITAISIFYFNDGLTKMNILIFVTLLILWFTMYLYKDIPEFQTNIKKLGIWVWPIILSIYQFTQAAIRVPIGMLSQKVNSRKKIVQWVGLLLLVAITLLIVSRMSVWAIIIASFISGAFGATFGLDAQYVSENWDIKQAFRSSVIVFIIPVMAEIGSKSLTGFIEASAISNAWLYLLIISMSVGTLTVVLYSFSKEDISSIKIDNMNNSKVSIKNRGKLDIFVISTLAALLLFMYTFVIGMSVFFNVGIWGEVIKVVSLSASIMMGLFLAKTFKAIWLKRLSMYILIIAFLTMGALALIDKLDRTTWIALSIIASIGFGAYIMLLFGTTLHFDHKYPALVMGIFLSVKSFMTGLGDLTSGELVIVISVDSLEWIGIYILIATVITWILMEITYSYFFIKDKSGKFRNMNSLIDDMQVYEIENSSKIVISNKK